jgi:hypothetical protein
MRGSFSHAPIFLHFRCHLFSTEDWHLWLCYTRRFLVQQMNTVSTRTTPFLPNSGLFFQCIENSFSCSFNLDLKGAMFSCNFQSITSARPWFRGMLYRQWAWYYVSVWMFRKTDYHVPRMSRWVKIGLLFFFFFFFCSLDLIFRGHRLISPCRVWLGLSALHRRWVRWWCIRTKCASADLLSTENRVSQWSFLGDFLGCIS